MNILFLDVDGVLNSDEYYNYIRPVRKNLKFPDSKIDPDAVNLLNYIVAKTDCEIVVSSAWRYGKTLDALVRLFHEMGIEKDIFDMTKWDVNTLKGVTPRGDEIQGWLDENKEIVTKYAILDDSYAMSDEQLPYTVFTDDKVGLTEENAEEIIRILNSK